MNATAINLPTIQDNTIPAAEHYARRYNYAGDMLRLYRRAFDVVKTGGHVCLYWNDRPMGLAAWRAEFMRALNARINGPQPCYRKLEPEWQVGMATVNYWGHDYVKIYWGDAAGNFISAIGQDYRDYLYARLDAAEL